MNEQIEVITLENFEVYKLAIELSKIAWKIYVSLSWQDKKVMGDQFITSVDSVGANVAEGFGRFHFLDRIKFFYNSRGSLLEANDCWIERLKERKKVNEEDYQNFKNVAKILSIKLNNFISVTYKSKKEQ